MKNQYEYTINSTEDISKALAEAERAGYRLPDPIPLQK